MEGIINLPQFSRREACISDLEVDATYTRNGVAKVSTIMHDGQQLRATSRFWMSLCSRFGIGMPIFRYFSHKEVFDRISKRSRNASLTLTIQDTPGANYSRVDAWQPHLLAVASNKQQSITADQLVVALNRLGTAANVTYSDGRIYTDHKLKREIEWNIGPDSHKAKIWLCTPIDGYGRPCLYLSMVRLLCLNKLVAMSKAFRSGIILGKRAAVDSLCRAVDSYSNEQGFVALKERIESAQRSWASVYECVQLSKILSGLNEKNFKPSFVAKVPGAAKNPRALRNAVLRKMFDLTGDLREIYGVAQLGTLSEKQQHMTASKATVYQLVCFATELATHQLIPETAQYLHEYVGRLIGSDIYDLEGSCDQYPQFEDFIDDNSRVMAQAS